jgi:methylenetetrahydrofolate reductase (NADPH)
MTTSSATTLWGHPRSLSDITSLFIRHLEGDLSSLPWSEDGLTAETETIRPQLLSLNRKGWWTIASQPAVNGVRSNDQIFGWGPKGGFVFQKAFVEFFLPAADWETLKAKLDNDDSLSYLAANAAGGFVSSGSGEGDRSRTGSVTEMNHGETNAVTWGVFPGKEIVSPTIVEEVSFKAWAQEAFELWSVWGECFKKGSEENKLLSEVRDGFWLVNVIGHEFVRAEGLWDVLGYADGGVENHGQKVEEK